jgi:adenylylsulfate kinase-like enzyme
VDKEYEKKEKKDIVVKNVEWKVEERMMKVVEMMEEKGIINKDMS